MKNSIINQFRTQFVPLQKKRKNNEKNSEIKNQIKHFAVAVAAASHLLSAAFVLCVVCVLRILTP